MPGSRYLKRNRLSGYYLAEWDEVVHWEVWDEAVLAFLIIL
jgi:hypothetical protein